MCREQPVLAVPRGAEPPEHGGGGGSCRWVALRSLAVSIHPWLGPEAARALSRVTLREESPDACRRGSQRSPAASLGALTPAVDICKMPPGPAIRLFALSPSIWIGNSQIGP